MDDLKINQQAKMKQLVFIADLLHVEADNYLIRSTDFSLTRGCPMKGLSKTRSALPLNLVKSSSV
jgi:hypothetical protein